MIAKLFSNLPVTRKMTIGFGGVLVLMLTGSGAIFHSDRQLAVTERTSAASHAALDALEEMDGAMARSQAATLRYAATGADEDGRAVRTAEASFDQQKAVLVDLLSRNKPELLPQLDRYGRAAASYMTQAVDREAALAAAPGTRALAMATERSPATRSLSGAAEDAFGSLHRATRAWSDAWTGRGAATVDSIEWVVLRSAALDTIVAALVGWFISRSISVPLGAMTLAMRQLAAGNVDAEVPARGRRDEVGVMAVAVQVFKDAAIEKRRLEEEARLGRDAAEAERARRAAADAETARHQGAAVAALAAGLGRMADGDLVRRIEEPFTADYEQLRADFNAALDKLRDAMSQVATRTAAIDASAAEIGSAADDLSRRTEHQAASLEETAAALEQITATVKKTAEGSAGARRTTGAASEEAARSGAVVDRAVAAMDRIRNSSISIGQIIGAIDEIAFQTNLLALNAGVEAARAGDAGRGFAVVASEVRTLAQRSAAAAKEIKTLIQASGTQVADGVTLVGEAGETLRRIAGQIATIDATVTEIAAGCEEQATGLGQVNTAVNQLDQATQQNAAMVEQTTAAVRSLGQDTTGLAELVGRFQVGDQEVDGSDVTYRASVARIAEQASTAALRPAARQAAAEAWNTF